MEQVVVELIKGFGTVGITAIFFIWLLSKLPTIYTNYDSFTNRNLKSLSDLTQSNTLNSSTGELISNFLAEQYLARNFKQPINGYEIQKINEIYHLAQNKLTIKEILESRKYLNLESINDPSNLIISSLDTHLLEKEFRKWLGCFSLVASIGGGLMAVLTSFPNFKYYNQISEPSFFYPYYIVLGLIVAYLELKTRKAKNNFRIAVKAFEIQRLLLQRQLATSS